MIGGGGCRIPWVVRRSWLSAGVEARVEASAAVIPNPTSEASFAPTIVDLLRQRSAYRPHDRAFTFLVDGENEELNITYAELDRKARSVGAWLMDQGMVGKRVLLLYPSGLDFIAAFMGCLYGGAIAVPAYPPRKKIGRAHV